MLFGRSRNASLFAWIDAACSAVLTKYGRIELGFCQPPIAISSHGVAPADAASVAAVRLKSLCSIHGVGLVTFALNRDQPDYLVVVLPVNAAPDMFYVGTNAAATVDVSHAGKATPKAEEAVQTVLSVHAR